MLDPSQVLGFVLFDLAVIVVMAQLLGWLARRVGQPTVVGQIVAGVLIGPTVLGAATFIWGSPWEFLHCGAALIGSGQGPSISACLFPPQAREVLSVIGQIGLALYMLLVGARLDHRLLRGRMRAVAIVAGGAVLVPGVAGLLIAPTLYRDPFVGLADPSSLAFALMVGGLLSITAFPVMAYILYEKRMDGSPMGSVSMAAAAVVTVLMFLYVAAADGVAADEGGGGLAVKALATGGLVWVEVAVVRRALLPLGRRIEREGRLDPMAQVVILTLVLISALVSDRIGLTVIPGAFLAGAVLPARRIVGDELMHRLGDLTLLVLLPVFLAVSGLVTDLTTLHLSALPAIGLFLAAAVLAKWGGGAVAARLGGLSWKEGNLLGVLLNCRGLLPLVVALLALESGIISPAMQAGAVTMALITTIMTGPLIDRFRVGTTEATEPLQ